MTAPLKIGVYQLLVIPSVVIPDDACITAATPVDSRLHLYFSVCALFHVFLSPFFLFDCLYDVVHRLCIHIVRFMFVHVGVMHSYVCSL